MVVSALSFEALFSRRICMRTLDLFGQPLNARLTWLAFFLLLTSVYGLRFEIWDLRFTVAASASCCSTDIAVTILPPTAPSFGLRASCNATLVMQLVALEYLVAKFGFGHDKLAETRKRICCWSFTYVLPQWAPDESVDGGSGEVSHYVSSPANLIHSSSGHYWISESVQAWPELELELELKRVVHGGEASSGLASFIVRLGSDYVGQQS